MDKIYHIEKISSLEYEIKNQAGEKAGFVRKHPIAKHNFIAMVFSGFFLGLINYYVFINFYLSFRLYDLKFLSLAFGFLAFTGFAVFFYVFLKSAMLFKKLEISYGNDFFILERVNKVGIFNLKYVLKLKEIAGRISLTGLISKKISYFNEHMENVFFIQKEKGFFLLKDKTHYFGYFSIKGNTISIDLSKDLNDTVSLPSAFASAIIAKEKR